MLEKKWVVGPFQCNRRLLACPKTGDAVLVDPGDDASRLLKSLQGLKTDQGMPVRVKYLLHTHGHLDHIAGTRGVKSGLQEKPLIALHKGDEVLYQNLKMQGSFFQLNFDDPLPVDHYLEDQEELKIGEMKISIIHTPGHSPGSVCLRIHENASYQISESLLSGDTLFLGSVGRTDLWGANQEQMFKSIRDRILSLDDDTRVCPGHGPDTAVGVEKRTNPFLT